MSLTHKLTGEVTHVGRVLRIKHNPCERIMSDVYASTREAVIVGDDGKLSEVQVSNSEFGCFYDFSIDATPEVKLAALRAEVLADNLEIRCAARRHAEWLVCEAKRLEKGKFVRVTRGRKVAKGTEGVLFWLEPGQFGMRAGIRDAQGNAHFTSADNLDVDLEVELAGVSL